MAQANKSKKGILIGAVILAVVIGILAVVYTQFMPKGTAGEKSIQVDVIFEDASTKQVDIQTSEEYLAAALQAENLIVGTESEYGLYVTAVDGVVADEGKQQWWCLTKGGEMVNTSFDQTPIADGDVFEITLTTGW